MTTQQLEQPSKPGPLENRRELESILREATEKIAPLWSLESFVTVNPYHGMMKKSFDQVADRLESVAGARTTMPESFYREALGDGKIDPDQLEAVLSDRDDFSTTDVEAFLEDQRGSGRSDESVESTVPTVADVATDITDQDWAYIMIDQISDWAAAYFDEGQAFWKTVNWDESVYRAWHQEAVVNRAPEVLGLEDFRSVIKSYPEDPLQAARYALQKVNVPEEGLDHYLHRLLMRVGGWSSYCSRIAFEADLEDQQDDTALEFLIVLLCWEVALLETLHDQGLEKAWNETRMKLKSMNHSSSLDQRLKRELVFQEAWERTEQQKLATKLTTVDSSLPEAEDRPLVQAAFCIDVRSEVFRRHLESIAEQDVETMGFPGFFGIPIDYQPLGHEHSREQCPPPLTTSHRVAEVLTDERDHKSAVEDRQLKHHVKRAWRSFKWGTISCFSFVGPIGLAYLPKLFTDAFGITRTVPDPDTESLSSDTAQQLKPSLEVDSHGMNGTGIPLEDQVDLGEETLNALSLTDGFADLVMITGHGATTVNNPYDSGLDCGACGGNAGSANAQVAAAILNNPEVRSRLEERGISIPEDTFFLACKHDTTTDEVAILNRDEIPENHQSNVQKLEKWLDQAGRLTREERSDRFTGVSDDSVQEDVLRRSRDWSQVRPEWGLAGCSSFIVAPRHRTRGLDLEGRSFLHHYDWREDEDFDVLELIMTAPMVVTTWINLQYYASTVDNKVFGSGNKTLHNVVGKLGIFEGNAGDLRTGLPRQSLHDGETYQHFPLRQTVVIEAPREAMNEVIEEHEVVRYLCDNNWIHLLSMDKTGTVSHRYKGNQQWEEFTVKGATKL